MIIASFIISGLSIVISLVSLALGVAITRRNASIRDTLDHLERDRP